MKRKRHSPEQIIRKLREAEGLLSAGKTIAEVCSGLCRALGDRLALLIDPRQAVVVTCPQFMYQSL